MHGWVLLENDERHPREKGLLTIKYIFSVFLPFLYFIFLTTFAWKQDLWLRKPFLSAFPPPPRPWYFNILLRWLGSKSCQRLHTFLIFQTDPLISLKQSTTVQCSTCISVCKTGAQMIISRWVCAVKSGGTSTPGRMKLQGTEFNPRLYHPTISLPGRARAQDHFRQWIWREANATQPQRKPERDKSSGLTCRPKGISSLGCCCPRWQRGNDLSLCGMSCDSSL